jgi:hypothetical protein
LVQSLKMNERLMDQNNHIYSDNIAVRNTLVQNKPMSVVGMKDGTLGLDFGVNNDRSFSIIPLCLESFVFQQMVLSYFEGLPKYDGILHDLGKTNF